MTERPSHLELLYAAALLALLVTLWIAAKLVLQGRR